MQIASGRVRRFIFTAFVLLSGTAMNNQAVCQTAKSDSGSNCSEQYTISKADTANWTMDQKKLLKNTVVPMIQKQVSRHWMIPKQGLFGLPHTVICASFTLNANGIITGAKIVRSSHSDYLDQLALNAVKRASPLDPLPPGLPVQHLSVDYRFAYGANPFENWHLAPLSLLPNSFKEPQTKASTFVLVVSVQPSLTEPLGALKDCCLEKWAEVIQNEWSMLVASCKDKNLVEIQASIEPDGTVDDLKISIPSGNRSLDRAALKSVSDSKLMMKVALHQPVKIRLDFLANDSPDRIIVPTNF